MVVYRGKIVYIFCICPRNYGHNCIHTFPPSLIVISMVSKIRHYCHLTRFPTIRTLWTWTPRSTLSHAPLTRRQNLKRGLTVREKKAIKSKTMKRMTGSMK